MSTTSTSRLALAVLALAIVIAAVGALTMPRTLLAGYLVAWWYWLGIALGAAANLWIHTLTGGAWGEPLRPPLLALARRTPLLALLIVPLLLGAHLLYPWTSPAEVARWSGEIAQPQFKAAWLAPAAVLLRSLAYLVLWSVLTGLSAMPRWNRSRGFAAVALLLYGFSVGLAALDWIMSLVPLWYSTTFGLVAGIGQMLAAFALGIVLVARAHPEAPAQHYNDLGNLLLMYVMSWAYLAFTQYLIIWAENLPHEIAWYVPRLHSGWRAVGILLVVFQFFLPFALLLFRRVKQRVPLARLAGALLAVHLIDVWWLIVPSLPQGAWGEIGWSLILWLGMAAAFYLWPPLRFGAHARAEAGHA